MARKNILESVWKISYIDDLVKSLLARHCEESASGGRRSNLMQSSTYNYKLAALRSQ
jgi:hypothetical protein